MKRLLLATSLLAASSATLAGLSDLTVTNVIDVTGKFVKPLEFSLDTGTINFGDVYDGKVIEEFLVSAEVIGTPYETFNMEVSSTNPAVTLPPSGVHEIMEEGVVALQFLVGLNTEGLQEFEDAFISITVNYNSIDETTTGNL